MDDLLILARQFPPYEGEGAVVRVLKFCKFLPSFGFKPIVVTVDKNPRRAVDATRLPALAEIAAHTEIHYIPEHPLVRWLEEVTLRKKKLKRIRRRSFKFRLLYLYYRLLKAVVSNLYRPVRHRLIYPDQGIFWNRRAARFCEEIIRRRGIRYLFTTSPLHSTQVLGLALKQKFNLTWCADFRDAWLDNALFKTKASCINRREEVLGKRVLASADVVTSVNDPIVRLLASHTDRPGDRRFVTVYNGFDEEEVNCAPYPYDSRFLNIVHCGIISEERDLSAFLRAMILKVEEGVPFRLHLVGTVNDAYTPRCRDQHPEVIRILGVASRVRTMQMLKGADVALLIFPSTNFAALSGKIFEYLGCDKRVIGLVPEGIAREFINQYRMGWTCDLGDFEGIKRILDEVHGMWRTGELPVRYLDEVKKRFDRRVLTGQIAGLLRQAASRAEALES